MEALLKQLNQLSSDLVGRIASCELEDMDAYMEERDLLFAELQQLASGSLHTSETRSLVEHIQQQDSIITGRMLELRGEANAEIDKLNKGKRTRSMYDSGAYGDDSLFFDTKR